MKRWQSLRKKADDPSVLHVRLCLRLRFRINCKYCSRIRFQFEISEAECGGLKGYQRVLSKQMPHFFGTSNPTCADLWAPNLQEYEVCTAKAVRRERDLDARFKSWHTNRAVEFFLDRHVLLISRRTKILPQFHFTRYTFMSWAIYSCFSFWTYCTFPHFNSPI